MRAATSCGASRSARCPASATPPSSVGPPIASAIRGRYEAGSTASAAPRRGSVGAVMRCNRRTSPMSMVGQRTRAADSLARAVTTCASMSSVSPGVKSARDAACLQSRGAWVPGRWHQTSATGSASSKRPSGATRARRRQPRLAGVLTVGEAGVHRGADRKARDQPPTRDAIEHRHLLGNTRGRVVEGGRVAHHAERDVARASRKGRSHQLRRGHQAIAVGMVLVDADRIEPRLGCELEPIEKLVGHDVDPVGVEQLRREIAPD